MSNQGLGSLERDVLRERQARERAQLLGRMQETLPPPIFSEPIKVDPSLEDETSRRVKSTLGDFQGILNTDPKNLIGISRSVMQASHSSKSSSSNMGLNPGKTSDGINDSNRKPSLLNGQHKSSHWNTNEAEIKHAANSTHQKNKDSIKSHSTDNKVKKRVQSSINNSSAVTGETLDKHRSSSYKTKKSSAFQNSEKNPSDNLCEERLSGKAADASSKKDNATVIEQVEYKNEKQQQIESILQEMRLNIPPPLTAICTPGRDEPFHFSSAEEPLVSFASQENDHSAAVEQCTDSTNSISPDLNILQPPPPVDAMSSSAKSSGESEASEPEISVSVPSKETTKKSLKITSLSRTVEKKHKNNHHQRIDKESYAGLKQDAENEKIANAVRHDRRGRNLKSSHEKDHKKSLSPHLSDLEMNMVQDAITEETLAVCPPLHPICVSPMSPTGHNSQEMKPSKSERLDELSTVVHKNEKMTKKKRSESNHRSSDSRSRGQKPVSSWPTNGGLKIGADVTINTLTPTNSAAISFDNVVKSDSEKSRKYKPKQEKIKKEVKEKLVKLNDENKTKTHKRTNSLEKKTRELCSRSSTPKEISKMDEESKVPKGNDAQKKKGKFHRFKSKEFITDSPNDSNSEDSDFDISAIQAAPVTKNSTVKTSLNDLESMPVKNSCLTTRPDNSCEQVINNHSEEEAISSLTSKEVLERVPTENKSSKHLAVITPVVLDNPVNAEIPLDRLENAEVPDVKPIKCQNLILSNINERQDTNITSLLISIDLKYIDRIPKPQDRIPKPQEKICEKQEVKIESNANTSNDHGNFSQTEVKVFKESLKRKHIEEKKCKSKKLKVTTALSPKTTLQVKKEKSVEKEECWDTKITPKSSERCDSPSSLCSFSSQQSHRSSTHHGRGRSVDKSKKERKVKECSQSEQKLKGHTPSKEAKLDEERKHKSKKEKGEEPSKSKERNKSAAKYQNSENSQGSGLAKSSQVYKSENDYRDDSRQDECASVSHDDVTEWNNANSSWLHPKQGIECEQSKYMNEAKKLKHEADIETDFRVQAMKYLDAVLCFILAGMAKEKSHCHVTQTYTLYKETLDLIRYIASKFQKNAQSSSQNGSMDTKLFVLSLRCQSLLYLKLYRLRRGEVREIHKTLSKFHKQKPNHRSLQTPPVATLSQPSPGHLKGGMPSPHSPTPSPAGSVASVGSQSSGYSSSEINGAQCRNMNIDGIINNPLPGVPSSHQQASQDHHDVISLPHTTYNMLQRQSTHLGNLHLCHDLWEQADIHISHGHCKEFFKLLDSKCGRLTLHSTFPELVEYIRKGLGMLKGET